MALVDFQSRYSFYTSQPPAVDYIGNTDAKGFITEKQPQGASDFVGILGSNAVGFKYEHTGIRNLGNMSTNLRPLNQDGNPARDTFVRGSVGNFTTRYQNNADDIPSITARGFERDGVSSIVISRTAKDEFPIDDVTFSDRGIAKRRAQLGAGSKFPIGPAGQVHNFDIVRTGFNDQSRYGDTYGPKSNSGLADTYTANSPIDDLYNKYKVRDEAHNPFTFPFTREPFILRGIQRDDNSKPQRWGLSDTVGGTISSTLNIPRGGPLTFIGRTLFDVARLGKFILSPKGLIYTAKQFGLQFMNPNVEDVGGGTGRGPRLTQLYDPTSFIVNAATAGIGIRFDRHGLPLGLFPRRGKYEQVHKDRRFLPLFDETDNNRLSRLRIEYGLSPLNSLRPDSGEVLAGLTSARPGDFERQLAAFAGRGQISNTLSGQGGPKSILGIGRTRFTRSEATDAIYLTGNGAVHGFITPSRALGNSKAIDIKNRMNYISEPYVESGKSRSDMDDGAGIKLAAVSNPLDVNQFEGRRLEGLLGAPSSAVRIYHDSLKKSLERNELWLDNSGITSTTTDDVNKYGGGVAQNVDQSGTPVTGKRRYASMDYNLIRELSKERTPDTTEIIDFQESKIFGFKRPYDTTIAYRYKMYQKAYDRYNDNSRRFAGRTEDDDLILIRIGKAGSSFPFQAYIVGLSDSFNPNYDTSNDVGVALPRYQMSSYTRTISLELQIAAENSEQLHNIWENIRGAASKTLPSGASSFTGQSTNLTVGRLYRELSVVMTNCTCNWDNETLWDIETGVELPKYGTIAMEFEVLSTGIAYPNNGPGAFSPAIYDSDKRKFDRLNNTNAAVAQTGPLLTPLQLRLNRGQTGTRFRPVQFGVAGTIGSP